MREYARLISLAGGILAFYCFVLPWESSYSGLHLAVGKGGVITTFLIVSLFIIGIYIYWISTKSNFNAFLMTIALFIGLIGTYICLFSFIQNSLVNLNYVTIAFIASLIIICSSIYVLNRQSHWNRSTTLLVVISSIVGFCCFLVMMFGENLNIVVNEIHIENVKYGTSLTAVGFILAIVGVLCFPNTENDSEMSREVESEEISVGEEE